MICILWVKKAWVKHKKVCREVPIKTFKTFKTCRVHNIVTTATLFGFSFLMLLFLESPSLKLNSRIKFWGLFIRSQFLDETWKNEDFGILHFLALGLNMDIYVRCIHSPVELLRQNALRIFSQNTPS